MPSLDLLVWTPAGGSEAERSAVKNIARGGPRAGDKPASCTVSQIVDFFAGERWPRSPSKAAGLRPQRIVTVRMIQGIARHAAHAAPLVFRNTSASWIHTPRRGWEVPPSLPPSTDPGRSGTGRPPEPGAVVGARRGWQPEGSVVLHDDRRAAGSESGTAENESTSEIPDRGRAGPRGCRFPGAPFHHARFRCPRISERERS